MSVLHASLTSLRPLSDECPLVDAKSGRLVSPAADRLVDEHFNCILDAVGEWRRLSSKTSDTSLYDQVRKFHGRLLDALGSDWPAENERLLNWQIGNVEFSCGASLAQVSARNWDQNEAVGQFAGDHALLCDGSKKVIESLAAGTRVLFGHAVERVEYGPRLAQAQVHCSNGARFSADRVVLCLPLAVYQRRAVKFVPPLPEEKLGAFGRLGAGLIEKVAVKFPRCFWKSLLKRDGTLDYFGNVPKSAQSRGLFNMFYDFSSRVSPLHGRPVRPAGPTEALLRAHVLRVRRQRERGQREDGRAGGGAVRVHPARPVPSGGGWRVPLLFGQVPYPLCAPWHANWDYLVT